jgi:hypothetical protein
LEWKNVSGMCFELHREVEKMRKKERKKPKGSRRKSEIEEAPRDGDRG